MTIFEQFEPGHTKGSSHGNSRIVRKAYPDALYTEIMLEGYPMWAQLNELSERPLLFECGLLYFGASNDSNMKSVIEGLNTLGVPNEVLDADACERVLPQLRLEKGEVGVFTPEAGWVHAKRSVLTSLELAQEAGAWVVTRRIEALEELESEFDAAVLCPGAWIGRYLELDVTVSLQTFAYVPGSMEGPVWIEEGPSYVYGFPSEPGRAAWKAGAHNVRMDFDPGSGDRPISQETLDVLEEFAGRRFGIVRDSMFPDDPLVSDAQTCLYTLTSEEDFRIGRAGEKIVFASACSGHGFKFGPWMGRLLADIVEGKADPRMYPRFYAEPKRLN